MEEKARTTFLTAIALSIASLTNSPANELVVPEVEFMWPENVSESRTYRLEIKHELSTVTRSGSRGVPAFSVDSLDKYQSSRALQSTATDPNDDAIAFEPQAYSIRGQLEVRVLSQTVNRLSDGTPRSPVTFESISVQFLTFESNAPWDDIVPTHGWGGFSLVQGEIPGRRYDICSVSWAMGYSCSNTVLYSGIPPSLSGSFDGERLTMTGTTGHDVLTPYYTFALEAKVVPIPPSVALLATGCLALASFRPLRWPT